MREEVLILTQVEVRVIIMTPWHRLRKANRPRNRPFILCTTNHSHEPLHMTDTCGCVCLIARLHTSEEDVSECQMARPLTEHSSSLHYYCCCRCLHYHPFTR